jgi:hypothetical protein
VQSGVQHIAADPEPTHSAPAPQLLLVHVPPQPSDMPQPFVALQFGVQQTSVDKHSAPAGQAGQVFPQLSLVLHSVCSELLMQLLLTQQEVTPARVTQVPVVQVVQVPPQPSESPQLSVPQVLVQHMPVPLSQTCGLVQPQVPPQPSEPPHSTSLQLGVQQASL